MDLTPVHRHKSTTKSPSSTNNKSKISNHDYRLRSDRKDNFPNGYLEDWTSNSSESPTIKRSSNFNNKPSINQNKDLPYTSLRDDKSSTVPIESLSHSILSLHISDMSVPNTNQSSSPQDNKQSPILLKYTPVSIILSTQSNTLLNKDTTHNIRFSTGMIEGSGISISDDGNEITFQDEGSYRFEICGDGAPFSDVDVKLIFHSDLFSEEVRPFSEIVVPKDEGKLQLRGLATILPIQKNQKISPRLIAIPDESIVLMGNTRLLIHRVA